MPEENTLTETEGIITKKDLEIVDADPNEKEDDGIPVYMEKIDFNDEQIKKLRKEVFEWFEDYKAQRAALKLEEKWDAQEAQYDGEMSDESGMEFNLNVPVTKVKVDTVTRLATKAFIDSDPMFSVTPRPESQRNGLEDTISNQEDYLDYLFDEEINVASPVRMAIHQASVCDCSIIKVPFVYKERKRKREEFYSGKYQFDQASRFNVPKDLKLFVQNYPDAIKPGDKHHKYFKKLLNGQDIRIVVSYRAPIYNNPKPGFVNIRDFFVDTSTEGYEGLEEAQCKIERQQYTWWELKTKEDAGEFKNVDEMRHANNIEKDGSVKGVGDIKDYRRKKYQVLEVDYWFCADGDDDVKNEERIICWFGVESKAYLGAIYYPYYAVDSIYLPFYLKKKKTGFYKGGIAEDLTDSNLAQNAILNFTLTGAWIANTITPIVKSGSTVARQFLEDRWTHGVPIELPDETTDIGDEIDFLPKTPQNTSELVNILLYMQKLDDDNTGISSLASGKESPTDPRAPAAKTALLMKQTGINIEDYINCLLPSFSRLGEIVLQLIYQFSREDRKFRVRRKAQEVTGDDPFGVITRDQMVARTNIQSRAGGFAFDKVNEKRENLALVQILREEPALARRPEAVWNLYRTLIKSWSPMWKNKVDEIWPSPEEFRNEQLQIGMQALQIYFQKLKATKEAGATPEVNAQEFIELLAQMEAAAYTPPQEEGS